MRARLESAFQFEQSVTLSMCWPQMCDVQFGGKVQLYTSVLVEFELSFVFVRSLLGSLKFEDRRKCFFLNATNEDRRSDRTRSDPNWIQLGSNF